MTGTVSSGKFDFNSRIIFRGSALPARPLGCQMHSVVEGDTHVGSYRYNGLGFAFRFVLATDQNPNSSLGTGWPRRSSKPPPRMPVNPFEITHLVRPVGEAEDGEPKEAETYLWTFRLGLRGDDG